MGEKPTLTIEQHVMAVRRNRRDGLSAFVTALQSDADLANEAAKRMKLFAEMDKANRLQACWISRQMKETLAVALTAAKDPPNASA